MNPRKCISILIISLISTILKGQDSIFTIKIRKEYPSGIIFQISDGNRNRPLSYQDLDIFLNDTLHYKFTTDSIGNVNRVPVIPGTYKIRITANGFQSKLIRNVSVNNGKSYVTFSMYRLQQ